MTKATIGKIQLAIGIIILIIAVIGIIASIILFKNTRISLGGVDATLDDITKSTLIMTNAIKASMETNFESNLLITSIILFFISLLFITQGKVNLSEK